MKIESFASFVELKVDQYSAGGFGGFIRRKKGAVAIRIDYKGIIMVYISCHLSGKFIVLISCPSSIPSGSHGNSQLQNGQLPSLVVSKIFYFHAAHARNVEERNSQCRHISRKIFSNNVNPYSRGAQITVWLGDLNYRINGITTHPTRNLIQNDLHHKVSRLSISVVHLPNSSALLRAKT